MPTTSPGTPARALRPAGPPPILLSIPCNGGFTFAEAPDVAGPEARIIWCAELDPETLQVDAVKISPRDPDRLDLDRLRPFLATVRDGQGLERAVLSDGWRRIRLDVAQGTIAGDAPIALRYHIAGLASAEPKLATLLRLLDLHRRRRFRASLFPYEKRAQRWIALLRAGDAVQAGASHREIADVLFGPERVADEWRGRSDSLRSRVRRLVRDTREMAAGGWRTLLRRPRT